MLHAKLKKQWTLVLIVSLASCTTAAPRFDWHPPIYAADSKTQSIVRKQGDKLDIIPTNNPRFDGFLCVPIHEVQNAVVACQNIINQCQVWKDPNSSF